MRVTVPQIHSSIISRRRRESGGSPLRSKSARASGGAAAHLTLTVFENDALLDEIADDVRHDLVHFLHDRRVAVRPHQHQIGVIRATGPPPFPVNATRYRAAALRRFFECEHEIFASVPLVVIPTTTSPGCTNASTWRRKT